MKRQLEKEEIYFSNTGSVSIQYAKE